MANPRRPTKVPPAEVHVESVFGEVRWENKAESEADGAWVIMQRARDMVGYPDTSRPARSRGLSSRLQRRQVLGLGQGSQANGDVNEVTQWSGPLENTGDEPGRLRYHPTLRSTMRESSLWLGRVPSIRQIDSSKDLPAHGK